MSKNEFRRSVKKVREYRAELKTLAEQRADLAEQMQQVIDKAKKETRALSDEEQTSFDDLEKKINAIDKTIEAEKRAQKLSIVEGEKKHDEKKKDDNQEQRAAEVAAKEERAFANFIRNNTEELRAGEIQLTQGNNGTIVPTTIANRIVSEVRDMVPYLTICDVVPTNGKLSVPVYGEDSTNYINADYVDEGTDLTDNIGKFTTVDLTGYVIGALALVSNKLVGNTDIDVVSFVVTKSAEAMAEKLELEFTVGTTNKITGIISTTRVVTAASTTAVTYDELVSVKHKIKQRFRKNAVWIMHPDTYTAICKLKDSNGQPYFKEDEYKILGCNVYESDSMPSMAAGNKSIIFADPKGYTIKQTKSVEIKVLREKFATKNMLGILSFGEFDGKVTDAKRISALQQKAS